MKLNNTPTDHVSDDELLCIVIAQHRFRKHTHALDVCIDQSSLTWIIAPAITYGTISSITFSVATTVITDINHIKHNNEPQFINIAGQISARSRSLTMIQEPACLSASIIGSPAQWR